MRTDLGGASVVPCLVPFGHFRNTSVAHLVDREESWIALHREITASAVYSRDSHQRRDMILVIPRSEVLLVFRRRVKAHSQGEFRISRRALPVRKDFSEHAALSVAEQRHHL